MHRHTQVSLMNYKPNDNALPVREKFILRSTQEEETNGKGNDTHEATLLQAHKHAVMLCDTVK